LIYNYVLLLPANSSSAPRPRRVRISLLVPDRIKLTKTSSVNAGMFAITPDAIFKVNSYAYAAVSASSAACGLGIACDVWLLVCYTWVELETFIVRTCLILATPTSSDADIVAHSDGLAMYTVHTSFSLYPHGCPPSACWCPPHHSWPSSGSSHMMDGP